MLDKGQQKDWFASYFIITLAVLAGLIARELMTKHPIVDLSVFKDRTYATGTFLMTVLGLVLYGSIVLLPLLMQTVLGYTALHAGVTNMPRGMALVGALIGKIEARKLLLVGLISCSWSFWLLSHMSLDVGYWQFFVPLIIQGASMVLLFIPLTTITNGSIPREKIGNRTSIFNLMGNIGASIGISIVTTLLARHQQVHVNNLGAQVSLYDPRSQSIIQQMTKAMMAAGVDAACATQKAYAALGEWCSCRLQSCPSTTFS